MVHLEKSGKETTPQVSIRQEPQTVLSRDTGAEHRSFAHVLRDNTTIAIASGLIATAALLTGCGGKNQDFTFKSIGVDNSLLGVQYGNTFSAGYRETLYKNGVPNDIINQIQQTSSQAEQVNAGDPFVFVSSKMNVTEFYEKLPANQAVDTTWFLDFGDSQQTKLMNDMAAIQTLISKTMPNTHAGSSYLFNNIHLVMAEEMESTTTTPNNAADKATILQKTTTTNMPSSSGLSARSSNTVATTLNTTTTNMPLISGGCKYFIGSYTPVPGVNELLIFVDSRKKIEVEYPVPTPQPLNEAWIFPHGQNDIKSVKQVQQVEAAIQKYLPNLSIVQSDPKAIAAEGTSPVSAWQRFKDVLGDIERIAKMPVTWVLSVVFGIPLVIMIIVMFNHGGGDGGGEGGGGGGGSNPEYDYHGPKVELNEWGTPKWGL